MILWYFLMMALKNYSMRSLHIILATSLRTGSTGILIGSFLCQDGLLLLSTMATILPQKHW